MFSTQCKIILFLSTAAIVASCSCGDVEDIVEVPHVNASHTSNEVMELAEDEANEETAENPFGNIIDSLSSSHAGGN